MELTGRPAPARRAETDPMTADPTAAPPVPPAGTSPLVEFVRTQRANAGYALGALAVAFLGLTLWLVARGERPAAAPPTPAAVNPLDPDAPPTPPAEVADPKRNEYRVGWIGAGLAFLVCSAGAVGLLARVPRPTPAAQRTYARELILAVGGLLGVILVVAGGAYFVLWSDSLTKWLGQGEAKEARGVVVPFLMVVAGAGLVLAAIQPARAEERDNQFLRRLVYGTNLGLTVVLLSVALVVANVVIALQVQNTLDTTATGFYTLSAGTKELLAKLPEPVTAYVVLLDDGGRETNDIKQLMYSAQDTAPAGKFVPRFVSPVSNKGEIQQLQASYPKLSKGATGVLLAVGEKGGRSAFIPEEDLFKVEGGRFGGEARQPSFVGEAAIVRELKFLGENEQKPVVYFTQAQGELALAPAPGGFGGAARDASQLKSFLERNYLEVRPLELTGAGPKVPDDAAVVVVADPQTPLPDAAAKALKEYATGPRRGKLIVAAGTGGLTGLKDRRPAKTGLEDLLGEFGVKLGQQIIYTEPVRQQPNPIVASAAFTAAAESNPIVQAIAPRMPGFPLLLPREVAVAGGPPGGPFQATPMLVTNPARWTWLEDERLDDPFRTYEDLENGRNPALVGRKQYTQNPRSLAAVVSEAGGGPHGGGGGAGRAVVFGNAWMFTNEFAAQAGGRGGAATPPTFDLLSVSIDWLRERPAVTSIPGKPYETYTFPQAEMVSETRLKYLPLGLVVFAVTGLGAGVWVMRRK